MAWICKRCFRSDIRAFVQDHHWVGGFKDCPTSFTTKVAPSAFFCAYCDNGLYDRENKIEDIATWQEDATATTEMTNHEWLISLSQEEFIDEISSWLLEDHLDELENWLNEKRVE